MKTKHVLAAALLSFALSSIIVAQPSFEKNHEEGEKSFHHEKSKEFEIPGLTDDQKSKLKELKLAHYKEVQPLRNQLGELKAKKHSLATVEKVDLKAIDANIDEITKLQNQLMKARAANIQKIRALLNDEQRMFFDSEKSEHHGFGEMDHERNAKHKGFWRRDSKEKACDSPEKDMPKNDTERK